MYQTNRFHFTMRLDGKYFLVFSCFLVLLVCFPMQGRLAFNHNVKNIEFNYTIFLNFYSKVGDDDDFSSLTRIQLSVSQNSALENFSVTNEEQRPKNDGTNACTFLALAICDKIFQSQNNDLQELTHFAEDLINELPEKINDGRNLSEHVEVLTAKEILSKKKCLSRDFDLQDEWKAGDHSVFSDQGEKEITESFSKTLADDEQIKVGIYMCSKFMHVQTQKKQLISKGINCAEQEDVNMAYGFTFMVGVCRDYCFLIDTHPISKELGGNGEGGILVKTKDRTPDSCKLITKWIIKRLRSSMNVQSEETVPHCLTWFEQSSGLLFITYITASPFQEYDWLGLHRFNH